MVDRTSRRGVPKTYWGVKWTAGPDKRGKGGGVGVGWYSTLEAARAIYDQFVQARIGKDVVLLPPTTLLVAERVARRNIARDERREAKARKAERG